MRIILVLNNGIRVVVKLHTNRLEKQFQEFIAQGDTQAAVKLLKRKAQVDKPLPYGAIIPEEYKSLITIVEQ